MPMKEHSVEQEQVMAFLDGELPAQEAAVMAAHIAECGECQELAAGLRNVSRNLEGWRVEPPSAWLPGKVSAALAGKRAPRGFPKWGVWAWWSAAACVVLMLLVLPKWFFSNVPPRQIALSRALAGQAASRANQSRTLEALQSASRINALALDAPAAQPNAPIVPKPPMIARSWELVLVAKEFDKTRGALEDILKRHRGYVGRLELSAPAQGPRTLNATLMVPADEADATVKEIRSLGKVESESQTGEEVTRQIVDLDSRLSNAIKTEQRLNALLQNRTGRMADVLEVENEVDRERGEIERMQAEKKNLLSSVDFATLSITLRDAAKAQLQAPSNRQQLRNAALEGFSTLADGAIAAAVFLLAYGPALLFWGGLAALALHFTFKKFRLNSSNRP
jgi:Domain of unknown function (DUF4349)/Putative zinc-finger